MKKLLFLLFLFSLISCGYKRDATGGPVDEELPIISEVYPQEFSNIYKSKYVKLSFSKPIERSTALNAIEISPTISKKSIMVDDKDVIIKFKENLQKNTNYFFSINQKIKCTHSNSLDKEYKFVFRTGEKLFNHKISGKIFFEKEEDKGKQVKVFLYNLKDSSMVQRTSTSENHYSFEYLTPANYYLVGFIDDNKNDECNMGTEAFFIKDSLEEKKITTLDITLTYIDTIKPKIQSANFVYNNQVKVNFSKKIKQINEIQFNDSLGNKLLNISLWDLKEDKLDIYTDNSDTTNYLLAILGIQDYKNNLTQADTIEIRGILTKDSKAPKVLKCSPTNSTSVSSLYPEITFSFDELSKIVAYKCYSKESLKEVEFDKIKNNAHTCILKPKFALENFNTYYFEIEFSDFSDNTAKHSLDFVVIEEQ